MAEALRILHFGTVFFEGAKYERGAGSDTWYVFPVKAFGLPVEQRPPVGQVRIQFKEPISQTYSVIVTACRNAATPLVSANYGDIDTEGFVVHLFETVADRTLQNCSFSFAVLL